MDELDQQLAEVESSVREAQKALEDESRAKVMAMDIDWTVVNHLTTLAQLSSGLLTTVVCLRALLKKVK